MAYRIDKETRELVIDGFQNGISASPYLGISNMRNINASYYPGVGYINYQRKAATLTGTWFAGIHSIDVSNNSGWIFSNSVVTMDVAVSKAVSPVGLIYILDNSGVIWKQSAVNSSTFVILSSGVGRFATGNGGIAYWQNYLVVFGDGVIEFCGDGTGDVGITSANWNKTNYGSARNTATVTTNYVSFPNNIYFVTDYRLYNLPLFTVNDPVQFTTAGSLPAGLVLNTTYYILTINYTNSFITVSDTLGGSAIVLSSDGTGAISITDFSTPLPLGNSSDLSITISSPVVGETTAQILSYVDPKGVLRGPNWNEASGFYNIVLPSGQGLSATFTHGSDTIIFTSALTYIEAGQYDVVLIDTSITRYRPYVSKVDGSLYFANGQFIGRIATTNNTNQLFNPALPSSYSVSFGVTSIPEQFTDTVVDLTDLNNHLIVAGQKDIYTWDYISAQTSSPVPVGESISSIINILNIIYILAGNKGNIYFSNGYSASLYYKIPDYIAGAIDPVWLWGDLMDHRSRLFFQAISKTASGTNILAGIFSLIVAPAGVDEAAKGLTMEAQNSYGLTPISGTIPNGVLVDNQQWSVGQDSYYSGWSNGASVGGIDFNDTSVWQNWEPTIETDIIPIGTILTKRTLGNIQFKLDRPMAAGDRIRMYWRPSLSASYVEMGTTSTPQLSDYYTSAISQEQWVQFMIQTSGASSVSSRVPLREIRISLI